MQQVHEGRYDFCRFTHLGHLRLFRHFEAIDSGVACGPGMALAWSWRYFLLSLTRSRRVRGLLTAIASYTSFWLKYLDRALVRRGPAYRCGLRHVFSGTQGRSSSLRPRPGGCYRGAM